jgi:hypothetical protein
VFQNQHHTNEQHSGQYTYLDRPIAVLSGEAEAVVASPEPIVDRFLDLPEVVSQRIETIGEQVGAKPRWCYAVVKVAVEQYGVAWQWGGIPQRQSRGH